MARIIKNGPGYNQSSEQTGVASNSIVIDAPGKGFAARVLGIHGEQRGGTSTRAIVNLQTSASAQDATAININVATVERTAGLSSNLGIVPPKPFVGGENQQITVSVNGNVNDSTETHLLLLWDTVKIR